MANEVKVRRNPFVGTKFSSAKAEFEARINKIDASIANALKSGSLKTTDSILYSARLIGSTTTVELMQSADTKEVGKTNINNRKLGASEYMLVTGIQMLSAVAATADDAGLKAASFGVVSSNIANGELEIKLGDKIFYPRNSNQVFVTTNSDKLQGMHILECPRIIPALTDVVPTLWLPAAAVEKTAVKIVFHGVKTCAA